MLSSDDPEAEKTPYLATKQSLSVIGAEVR